MDSTAADPCAICLGDVGRGQAIFTAECSHTFHLRCISASVVHGHRECSLCKATWRDGPAVDPVPVPPQQAPRCEYDDDDPVAAESGGIHAQNHGCGSQCRGSGGAEDSLHSPAFTRDASRDGFAVLVHVTTLGAAAAAVAAADKLLDLVTVLDISGSMRGEKLALLKQAMA